MAGNSASTRSQIRPDVSKWWIHGRFSILRRFVFALLLESQCDIQRQGNSGCGSETNSKRLECFFCNPENDRKDSRSAMSS
jgi:hypothetical protein